MDFGQYYIPEEIVRHILSYSLVPSSARVCRMFHCILKDKEYDTSSYDVETFTIDYKRDWDYISMLLYKKVFIKDDTLRLLLYYVGYDGKMRLKELLPIHYAESYRSSVILGACKAGRIDLVRDLLSSCCHIDNDKIIRYAKKGGHKELIRWLESRK